MTIQKPFFVIPYNLSATSEAASAAGFPASNLGDFNNVGMVFRAGAVSTDMYLRGDFGVARSVDFCAVVLANAQPGTTIDLALAATNGGSDYYNAPATFINPARTRDDGLYSSHFEISTPQTYRYWRIGIHSQTSVFEASKIILGKKITTLTAYEPTFGRAVEGQGSFQMNANGIPNIEPGVTLRSIKFTLRWITELEYETLIEPLLIAVADSKPVYLCFDSEPTVYRQAKSFFGWLRNSSYATGDTKPGTYSRDFELLSMI
jgi:hypothetical protein